MYVGEIERRWTLKEIRTAGWFIVSVYLIIAPPFVLIRVMLLVSTNTSCVYKRVEPRYIRLTKIVIFDDTLCKIRHKLTVILFLTFLIIICVFHSIGLIWPLYFIFITHLLVFYKPSYYFSLIWLAVNSIFQLVFIIILSLPLLR